MMRVALLLVLLGSLSVPSTVHAQEPDAEETSELASVGQPSGMPANYVAVTPAERIDWLLEGQVSPRSNGVGVLSAWWQTTWVTPEEWGFSWSGFGKRYLERQADIAISGGLEAGVGAIWGEDPRYIPCSCRRFWQRTRWAMKTVLLAPRPDGHLAPAWGRVVGNTLNNVIENAWLPPSVTTPGETTLRSVNGFLGRLAGNLFDEFWPDVARWLSRRR
ncbi:MAG TPA: hypothetical protein VH583_25170 [Vicinamibacterales bacterium]